MRGVDARRTFLQYDCIFIEIALFGNVTFVQIGANCGGPCPARQHNKLAKAKIPFGITLGALGGAVLR